LHEFAGIANVYRSWGIKAEPTQLVLGSGESTYRRLNMTVIEKLKTASIIAGAALLVVACGEKKAEEAPAAEAPAAEAAPAPEAAPAADAMAPAADAAAPAADAAAPAAPAADAAAAPAAPAAK
jgi:hypothetical protein